MNSSAPSWLAAALIVLWGMAPPASAQEDAASPDSLRTPAAAYVGTQRCRQCHPGPYELWLGTPHARSWVFLGTEAARRIAEREKIETMPAQNARCLRCHATAAEVPPRFRAKDFHLEEGAQCESCHGPGGEHARRELRLGRRALRASRMARPGRNECLACHKSRASHREVLGVRPFEFEKAARRIAHSESWGERLELLRRRPVAVLSALLRKVLYPLY